MRGWGWSRSAGGTLVYDNDKIRRKHNIQQIYAHIKLGFACLLSFSSHCNGKSYGIRHVKGLPHSNLAHLPLKKKKKFPQVYEHSNPSGKNSSIFNVLYSETGWHKPQFCRDHLPWGMKSRCMLTENAEGHILRSSSHDHSGWFQREVNIAFLLYTPTLCHTEGNASEQAWMKPDIVGKMIL